MDYVVIEEVCYDLASEEDLAKGVLLVSNIASAPVLRVSYANETEAAENDFDGEIKTGQFIVPFDFSATVIKLAKITAQLFVDEFPAEPLNSAGCDWDAISWQEDGKIVVQNLNIDNYLSGEIQDFYWDLYQSTLEEEIDNLNA